MESRDWMLRAIDRLRQDLRFSLRSLRATPTVTAVAVLSLALGIGANAAVFSIINSLLLRMLPVKDPARLVVITDTPTRARSWSYPIWLEIHRRQHLFEDSAAWSSTRFDLSPGGQTQFVDGLWVSGSFFDALGVKAALGRTLSASDDQRNGGADGPVAVISDRFWRGHFNGAATWLSRFVASLLYGVQPYDTATWAGAFIVLPLVGLVAGAIPATKAARTHSAMVLRES
jgi:hypothetical protein